MDDVKLVLFEAPDQYFSSVFSVREAADDAALLQVVQEAEQQCKKIGEIVDSRPAFCALHYARAADHVLQPPRRVRQPPIDLSEAAAVSLHRDQALAANDD